MATEAPVAPAQEQTPTTPAQQVSQQPAQEQAPVEQPAPQAPSIGDPQQPAQEPPASTDDGGKVTYEPTGDAALDVALSFVGSLGISSEHPAMRATASGDFSLIEAHLATMGDKAQGWQQMVQLAKDAYQRNETARTEAAAKTQQVVHAVAGSPDAWNTIVAWASENATADEKQQINAMFDAGPVQARAAAVLLKQQYDKAAGTVVNPANPVRKGASGSTTQSQESLSPAEYAAEVRKLHAQLGPRMEQSQEYAALRSRLRAR